MGKTKTKSTQHFGWKRTFSCVTSQSCISRATSSRLVAPILIRSTHYINLAPTKVKCRTCEPRHADIKSHIAALIQVQMKKSKERKLFFWGLEIRSINSYILYKWVKKQRNERLLSYVLHVKTLVNQLRDFQQTRDRTFTSISSFDGFCFNGKLHVILIGVKKDCKVCFQRNQPGGRHQITFYCNTCPDKPRIHLDDTFYTIP